MVSSRPKVTIEHWQEIIPCQKNSTSACWLWWLEVSKMSSSTYWLRHSISHKLCNFGSNYRPADCRLLCI